MRRACELVQKFTSAAVDSCREAPPAVALMLKVIDGFASGTCRYFTRQTHAACWFGSEQMLNDLEAMGHQENYFRQCMGFALAKIRVSECH